MPATKKSKALNSFIPEERIENKIYLIRDKKVMLDSDLAELYEIPIKRLKEQVRRNLKRFPSDFMIELTWEEVTLVSSRTQFATLNQGQNIKYRPFAFTEQGVAMLSTVLNSDRAIEVNIGIMRAFVKLRELMLSHKDLARKIEELERKFEGHDKSILLIFKAIRELIEKPPEPETPKVGIGFHVKV